MKYAILILVSIVLSSCGSDNSSGNLPTIPMPELESFELSDFSLSKPLDYWQIEQGSLVETSPDEVLYQFDADIYDGLSDELKANIDAQNSNSGFTYSCEPSSCAYYGVTLEGNVVDLVVSSEELVELFDEIDTAAELSILVWANRYSAKLYEPVTGGYRVVADLISCETESEELLEVDSDGSLTQIRVISSRSTGVVC